MPSLLPSGRRRSLCFLGLLALSACQSEPPHPSLGELYSRAANYHEHRNPVILIPGVTGSKLFDEATQQQAWGVFKEGTIRPTNADGARTISHPMGLDARLHELTDTIREDGALDRVELSAFGLPIVVDAYRNILGTLGVGGYRDELLGKADVIDYGDDHFTCFQFSYDWRRDLSEAAVELHHFIEEKAEYVRQERIRRYGDASPVKFDIVAHSMGGLVARYYARYGPQLLDAQAETPPVTWEGAERIERLVMIGTPNGGALAALKQLTEGLKLAPFVPRYPPAIVGTLPAVYELLPRPRHAALLDSETGEPVDLLDPELWIDMEWGLAAPDQVEMLRWLLPDAADDAQRRRIALDHQAKCLDQTRALQAALDQPASPPQGLDLYLLAGDASPTFAAFELDREAKTATPLNYAPGDGVVLRTSALMDERRGQEWEPYLVSPIDWSQVQFLFKDHLGLTKDPAFVDNVLYILLEDPRR